MEGIKHVIECSCFLPQAKNNKKINYYKFPVFSIINEKDEVLEKFAQCENCGIVHRVYDICRSEILIGREDGKSSVLSKEEISMMLPTHASNLLNSYNVDIATWEQVLFNFEKKIDKPMILFKEIDPVSFSIKGKILKIIDGNFKIESFIDEFLINKDKKNE